MYNFQIHIWLTFCFFGTFAAEPVAAQRTWDDTSIRREQVELRQQLDALERKSRSIELRLRNLDQIFEVKKELDRVVTQLKEARSSNNRVKIERLQSRVNPLMRHLDDLREALEAKDEPTELRNELDSHLEIGQSGQLKSGEYFVTQSWSQEENFRRPYFVNIPRQPANKKLPVLIFLHGNGGNAPR
ncbi:MAG: hypothetical protein ACPHO8_14815, partial [Mariniblastus sp.]